MDPIEAFIMGTIAMASGIVAMFFLRFWRDTGDRLFGMFAASFLLLGITRLGLVLTKEHLEEGQTYWYWVRLAAFVLILVAIIDKNRKRS